MADIPDIRQNVQADFVVNSELEISVQSQDENEIVVDMQLPENTDVDISNNTDFDTQLQSPPFAEAEFGLVYRVEGASIEYATTNTWNSKPQFVAKRGWIYVYSDWKQDVMGNNLCGTKIGDGTTFLIDLPFQEDMWFRHIEDITIHVTPEEKEFWNNKVRCYMSESDTSQLIFTTQ